MTQAAYLHHINNNFQSLFELSYWTIFKLRSLFFLIFVQMHNNEFEPWWFSNGFWNGKYVAYCPFLIYTTFEDSRFDPNYF
jgi:hypothetical protein